MFWLILNKIAYFVDPNISHSISQNCHFVKITKFHLQSFLLYI